MLRRRLWSCDVGGGWSRRVMFRRAPMAEGNFAPGKDVMRKGLLGAPAAETPDGVGGFTIVGPCRSPTAPKGVPSKTHPK